MSQLSAAARAYKLKAAVLARVNRLLERMSPGWGLRRRLSFLDQIVKRIESQGSESVRRRLIESFEARRRQDVSQPLLAQVRCGKMRFPLLISSREAVGTSPLTEALLLRGIWEPVTSRLIGAILKPGDAVLDVGANIGYYSILAGKLVGRQGRVFAFEPDPYTFELLRKNIELNGLTGVVEPVCKAVGQQQATAKLFLSPEDSGDHRLFDPGDGRAESVPVECVRLDDFLLKEAPGLIERLRLVKMDIQGYEVAAYRGMQGFLARMNPELITEYEPCTLASAGTSAKEYLELLQSYGYREFSFISWDPKQQAPEPAHLQRLLLASCSKEQHARHGYLYCRKASPLPGHA